MKKMLSIITSAVIMMWIVSVHFSAKGMVAFSADNSSGLKAGYMGVTAFDGITFEFDGDSIKVITDYEYISAGSETEISLDRTDGGFIFRPAGDGKYILSVMHETAEPPVYGSIWFPPMESFAYEIEITDGIVNINAMHRLRDEAGENQLSLIESFFSDGTTTRTEVNTYSVFGCYYFLIYLAYDIDHLFLYGMFNELETPSVVASFILSNNEEAEVVYFNDKEHEINQSGISTFFKLSPEGESHYPKKIFPMFKGLAEGSGPFKAVLNEGRNSTIYNFECEYNDPVPSSLKITECPENDINADGSFNVADVVNLQSFLLGKNDRTIINWRAADICSDGKLDVFDLVFLKKALITVQQ